MKVMQDVTCTIISLRFADFIDPHIKLSRAQMQH